MSNFGFVKIFGSLLSSTVWVGQPPHRKLVWIAMLVKADQDGYVASSIPGLARDAEVTIEQCEDALAHFMSPDRYSRTKDHDGRRVEEVDGGWVLLNHKKYRELRSREQMLTARRVAKSRAKKRGESEANSPVAPSEPKRRRATSRTSSVTSVTDVSSNASNGQKQIQISEADPDPDLEGGAKDRSSSARARAPTPEPPPPEPPIVERVQPIVATRSVPPDWEPKAYHRTNAKLYGIAHFYGLGHTDEEAFELEVTRFRTTEFKAVYSDWDKRFDRWLIDRRTELQTENFKRSQQQGPSPRNGSRALGTLQLQPDFGMTGFEGVEMHSYADELAREKSEDDDGEAA